MIMSITKKKTTNSFNFKDWDDKMEVLRLLKANPKMNPAPQETPVDLTTSGKMSPASILQQMSYPHLRLFSTESASKQESDSPFQTPGDNSYKDIKMFKEYSENLKKDSFSLDVKQYSKKRSIQEEDLDSKYRLMKRQKTEFKDTYSSQLLDKEIMEPNYSAYHLNPQYFPYLYFDHSAILERIKATDMANMSPSSLKETESLLAAVQHSQMLYYSYCSKLLQNLQTRRFAEEQQNEHVKPFGSSRTMKDKKRRDMSRSESRKTLKPTSKLKPNPTASIKNSMLEEISSPQGCSYHKSFTSGISFPSVVQSQVCEKNSLANPSSRVPVHERELDSSPSNEEPKGTVGRKRAPRALTGKHVRQGTGASLSTLQTLRQKLEERQRNRRSQSVTTDEENTSVED